jgi:hypothetical protein
VSISFFPLNISPPLARKYPGKSGAHFYVSPAGGGEISKNTQYNIMIALAAAKY